MVVVVEGRRSRKGDVIQARVFQKFANEIVEPVLHARARDRGSALRPPAVQSARVRPSPAIQQPSHDDEKSKASCRFQAHNGAENPSACRNKPPGPA